MCFISKLFKKGEEKPDWVTQSREEVAEEEIYAASIHYTYMQFLEEGDMTYIDMGDWDWHDHWYRKHMEAAWYDSKEYCLKVGISS